MLIIHASIDHNLASFIALIEQSNCDFTITSFEQWDKDQDSTPEGFIYIYVAPEITVKKLQTTSIPITLEYAQQQWNKDQDYFVHNNRPSELLQTIPTLLLNGNINFADDFSQFYTHLFAIKKFFQNIKDTRNKAAGKLVISVKKHKGCKC